MKKYLKNEIKHIPMVLVGFVLIYGLILLGTHLINMKKDNNEKQRGDTLTGVCAINYAPYNTRLSVVENTIGNTPLTTTSQTLKGAVNELDANVVTTPASEDVQEIYGTQRFIGNFGIQETGSKYRRYRFINSSGTMVGYFIHNSTSATYSEEPRYGFVEYSPKTEPDTGTTNKYEYFRLPATPSGMTTSKEYQILTGKTAVTVAQGGTGATTAAAARTNLEAAAQTALDAVNNSIPNLITGTIAASGSKTLSASASTYAILVTTGSATNQNGMWLIRFYTSTSLIVTIKAASNITLTGGTGNVKIANTNTSNAINARIIPLSGDRNIFSIA